MYKIKHIATVAFAIALMCMLQSCLSFSQYVFLGEYLFFSRLSDSSIENYKRILSEAGHDELGFPKIPEGVSWREYKIRNPKDSNDYVIVVSVNLDRWGHYKSYNFVFDKNKSPTKGRFSYHTSPQWFNNHDGVSRSLDLEYDYNAKEISCSLSENRGFTKEEYYQPDFSDFYYKHYKERYKTTDISLEKAYDLMTDWDRRRAEFEQKIKQR